MNVTEHESVLLEEVLDAFSSLSESTNPTFLDCTLGGGGHSESLLRQHQDLFLVGTDRDTEALERTSVRLSEFKERIQLVEASFSGIANPEMRSSLSRSSFDGVLLDLGISSDQLNTGQRGFSFSTDGPLDMRMGSGLTKTAEDILNTYSKDELKKMFYRGGVSKNASKLAELTINSRPLKTTKDFAKVCQAATPVREAIKKNPSALPFQALRIEVNDELGEIDKFFAALPEILAPGAKLAAISFHSLEDQLVASSLRAYSRKPESLRRLPSQEVEPSFGRLLTKNAITPNEEEINKNPRARSARMRVFQRGM